VTDDIKDTESEGRVPEESTQPADAEPSEQQAEHHVKDGFRGAVGKVVGIAVEAGSMLSGYSGEMVSAEGAIAQNDTEQFIDNIDGDG
jgi:hypothetical protein